MDKMSQKTYVIWGTGEDGKACYELLNLINAYIPFFVDNNENLFGKKLFDKPVLNPEKITEFTDDMILVIGSEDHYAEITKQVREILNGEKIKIVSCTGLFSDFPEVIYNDFIENYISSDALDREILYDCQIFSNQIYGGVTRYFEEIINGIAGNYKVDLFKGLNISKAKLSDDVRILFDKNPDNPLYSSASYRRTYNRLALQSAQDNLSRYKIYHPTYYDDYNLNCYEHLVVTVYDMIHEIFDMDPSIIQKKKQLVHKADTIIAISESTKSDIIKYLGVDEKKIKVIYLGNSLRGFDNHEKPYEFPYILFVGNRGGYKNFETLINAFSRTSYVNDFHLVCFGGGRFTNNELELIQDLKLFDKVGQISGSDSLLAAIYQGAEVFVYPSLYEGFGLPLLEAMHLGTPVITSCTSSMPEIGGDAALYFDPYSIEDLSNKLELMLTDNELRSTYSILGQEREKFFSWEKCVYETKLLYDSLIN